MARGWLESLPRLSRPSVAPVTCPFCGRTKAKVIDSRLNKPGDAIRRRRQCLGCGRRFTTFERIDDAPYMVIKKDGRREPFDRQKVLSGLLRACEKRPIKTAHLQRMVSAAELLVTQVPDRECRTSRIGELLMRELKQLDKVAYVRFASVYRDFKDEHQFVREIQRLGREQPETAVGGKRSVPPPRSLR